MPVANESYLWRQRVEFAAPESGMTLSPNGRDACLSSDSGLLIVDLAFPEKSPMRITTDAVVPASELHWSPRQDHLIAATANRLAIVVDAAKGIPTLVLESHARAVTDLHWSSVDPHLLTTAALDARVHLWDTRTPSRPALSFSETHFAGGVTQVLYNRRNEFVIASAHSEGAVCVWDTRRGSRPVKAIQHAHIGKVHSLDWSPKDEYGMITSGQDRIIRIWDLAKEECIIQGADARLVLEIRLRKAARRARYTVNHY